jgi:hypothetical protein
MSGMKRGKIAELALGALSLCGLVILLAFALLYAIQYASSQQVDCVRQANATYNCQTRTLFLDRVQTSKSEYVGVTYILMTENCDNEGCMYSATFITENGESIPLSFFPENNRRIASEQQFMIGKQMAERSEHISYRTDLFRGNLPLFCYVAAYIVVVVAVLIAKDRYFKYRQRRKTML